jgi:protein O-GlcNAc transferase
MAAINIQQAFDLALEHHKAGRLQEAQDLYQQILAQQPSHFGAMQLLGVIAYQQGKYESAVDLIRRAISLHPDFPQAQVNLGNALKDMGQLDEAIAAFRQAIALRPNYAEAFNNLGNALKEKRKLDEAIAAYRQAILHNPNMAMARSNLGNALKDNGQLDEAIDVYRQTIAFSPSYADAYSNLGNALKDKGLLDEAIAAFRQAISLSPAFAEAHNNLGLALMDRGELDEAIAAFRQAIAVKPGFVEADSNLVLAVNYHGGYEAQAIAEEHRRWSRQHAEPLRGFIPPHENERDPDRPLRIGYVSADFREHAVSRFLLPLFRHHDHSNFRIVCYSDVFIADRMTDRLRACAEEWRETCGQTDERMAQQIRQDKIDILIDLAGHTACNRLRVFARKPAPVQVTYLGYPATTGLAEMDYRMTDAIADPPGKTESLHTEKLWRLPVCNWCFGEPEDAPPPRLSRPDAPICFGSFNSFAKASPAVMELWVAILKATPESRLIIKSRGLGEPGVRQDISRFFESRGVQADRVEIRGKEPEFRSHLALYNQVDIALDTFPYHGTTTTCEALWMGVPVVSLAGQTHVSRVGVSLLNCIGLAELIAQSPEEYKSIAVRLAGDLPRLAELRRTLRERMRASPLMDATRFAGDIEAAYRQMWRTWCESGSQR